MKKMHGECNGWTESLLDIKALDAYEIRKARTLNRAALPHCAAQFLLILRDDHSWDILASQFSECMDYQTDRTHHPSVRPLISQLLFAGDPASRSGNGYIQSQVRASSLSSDDILGSISRSPLPSEAPFVIVVPPCDLIFILDFVRDLHAVVMSTTAAARNTKADVAKRCRRIRCNGGVKICECL